MPPIHEAFTVHRLNPEGLAKAEQMAEAFTVLMATLDGMIPSCRERSLVVTKLQEAAFFAKRSMALDPANQVPK